MEVKLSMLLQQTNWKVTKFDFSAYEYMSFYNVYICYSERRPQSKIRIQLGFYDWIVEQNYCLQYCYYSLKISDLQFIDNYCFSVYYYIKRKAEYLEFENLKILYTCNITVTLPLINLTRGIKNAFAESFNEMKKTEKTYKTTNLITKATSRYKIISLLYIKLNQFL